MSIFIAIFIGGGTGALMRHLSALAANALLGDRFPYGTLFVNVVGSLAIGFIMEGVARKANIPPHMQALLVTGFLGGFTTFSAFSLDVFRLNAMGDSVSAAAYVGASVFLSLVAVFAGSAIARGVFQ